MKKSKSFGSKLCKFQEPVTLGLTAAVKASKAMSLNKESYRLVSSCFIKL